jgi:hypothetical protein
MSAAASLASSGILDLADQFFDDVFQEDAANYRAIWRKATCNVSTRLAHLSQSILELGCFWN